MKIDLFLQRIKFAGPVRPDLATLKALKSHFLQAVPFENLDIHYGTRGVTLKLEGFFDKIVNRHRGGICFENNLLFAWALRELGFDADIFGAEMMPQPGVAKLDETHLFIHVLIDGVDYAVDVGNGQSYRTPLRMDGSDWARTPEDMRFRISPFREGPTGTLALYQRASASEETVVRYAFVPTPRSPSFFEHACHWVQTSPESNFVQGPMATLALPDGRITATLKRLKTIRDGIVSEIPLAGEGEFLACLKDRFQIEPDGRRRFPAAGKGEAEPRT